MKTTGLMAAVTCFLLAGCQPERTFTTSIVPEHHNFQLYEQGHFLVDTETGRVWEMKSSDSGAHVFQPVMVSAITAGAPSAGDPLGLFDSVDVKAPNGTTYHFPDKAHADAFKKAAHIQ